MDEVIYRACEVDHAENYLVFFSMNDMTKEENVKIICKSRHEFGSDVEKANIMFCCNTWLIW